MFGTGDPKYYCSIQCSMLSSLFLINMFYKTLWFQVLWSCVFLSLRSECLVKYWDPLDQVLWPPLQGTIAFLLIDLMFYRKFRFTKNWAEKTVPIKFLPLPTHILPDYQGTATEWYNHYNQWTYIHTPFSPKFQNLHWAFSWCFDKCIVTQIYHSGIAQSSFTALKIFCTLPVHPSSPQHLITTDFFFFFSSP